MKKIMILLLVILICFFSFFLFKDLKQGSKKNKSSKSVDALNYDNYLFGEYYNYSDTVLKEMSLEEKVGQLFLVRYDQNLASSWVSNYKPGGFILFAKDFEDHTRETISKELLALQEKSAIPLVLGVDEEGGYVTRISKFTNFREKRFSSPRSIYESGGFELLEKVEIEKAQLLLGLGINFNLAPVVDVSVSEHDFIYNRAFGYDALQTSEFSANMVKYANSQNISSCLKHFPGYGSNVDTHDGIAIDNRSYDEFVNNDFLPFKSGIEAGAPVVMVSHNIVNCMDSDYPATLSKKVVFELRNTLGFSGIVITDDLAMKAVSSYVSEGSAAVLAINAGNDMIITSDFVEMYDIVLEAVKNKKIEEIVIDEAVRRIIAWKKAYNM